MAGSLFGNIGSVLNSGPAGWQPKSSRIRVGRDVGAFSMTTFHGEASRNTVLGETDEVTLKSRELFKIARQATLNGGRAANFRSLTEQIDNLAQSGSTSLTANANNPKGVEGTIIQQKGDYAVSYNNGILGSATSLTIYKKDAASGEYVEVESAAANQDIRISWGDDGAPQIQRGASALTNGVLAAQGKDDILFRHSSVDVKAGDNTTVFNASSAEGNFSGGNNVTYLGSYLGGTFTETTGNVNFAGYFNGASFSDLTGKSEFSGVFENAAVDLEDGEGTFSGYFSASDIQAGNKGNTASGLFLDGSVVRGGDGDDSFSGRFIESQVDGGKGNDSFGNARSMSNLETLTYTYGNRQYTYRGLASDFIDSTLNAGGGDDTFQGVMTGGTLNLDQDENNVFGIFANAAVNGGTGNDTIESMYSRTSSFNTGLGDDTVTLTTAYQSTVTTDEGTNKVTLGKNDPKAYDKTWQTRSEYHTKQRPMETGELQHNTVRSEKGDNTIGINNGESTVAVLSGNNYVEAALGKTVGLNEEEDAAAEEKVDQETAGQAQEEAAAAASPSFESIDASSLLSSDDKEEDAVSDERTVRYAIDRYLSVYGMEPLNPGTDAVTVHTAPGESRTFKGTLRDNEFVVEEKAHMARSVRRWGGDGTYSWMKWEKLRG